MAKHAPNCSVNNPYFNALILLLINYIINKIEVIKILIKCVSVSNAKETTLLELTSQKNWPIQLEI
jgi:hypothetical protein